MHHVSLADLDRQLTATAFFQDPYQIYERLRTDDPVHWSDTLGAWVLTRYDDVLATIRDTQSVSSQGRNLAVLAHIPPEERVQLTLFERHFRVGLISSDPPDHTRLRTLINKAFTPRVIDRLRPHVQQLVDTLIDANIQRGEMDIIRDVAYPLPATVIAELLGAPPEARDRFKQWTQAIHAFQGTGRATLVVLLRAQEGLRDMRTFLLGLIAERRMQPREDLISLMVEAEADGDKLTEAELLTTCVTLLTAGHETTTNLIGNGLYTLLQHPAQYAQLRDDMTLLPSAIEEILRYESPIQRNPRRVARDFELRGKALHSGDFVLQMLGAANRDPAVFANPGQFEITRQPNRHIGFGFGLHFCLGAPLARMEAQITLTTLLQRLPRLQRTKHALTWHEHGLLRGLNRLPVVF